MKTISKKIKSIYLLAIMAVLCACLAVFPVFKTETVKAAETGLSLTGAKFEFSRADAKEDTANDFALMFQAEITSELYAQVADKNATFGMLIGPKATVAGITSYDQLANLVKAKSIWVNEAIVGTATAEAMQLIDFAEGQTTFTYEAGTFFDKTNPDFAGVSAAQWQLAYDAELTAIAFYIVDGAAQFDASVACTASASALALETWAKETALPISQATISPAQVAALTGKKISQVYNGSTIYLDQNQKIFLAGMQAGGPSYYGLSTPRWWFPYESNKGSSAFLGTAKYNTRIMGGKILANPGSWTKSACTLTATKIENFSLIDSMVPGEKYLCYYTNVKDSDKDDADIQWFEYEVATRVFTNLSTPTQSQASIANAQGTRLLEAVTMTEGGSSTIQGSYFVVGHAGSSFYHPYGKTSGSYVHEQNGYGGHYILANDIVVTSPVEGSNHLLTGTKAEANRTYGVHKAPTNGTEISQQTIGALKEVPEYITTINPALIKNLGFTGTFDGKGHTIDASFVRGGLFGIINGGTVKNLNINADLYKYALSSKTVNYTVDSYAEKNAVLAELIMDGSTIENVQITLKENAPTTFANKQQGMENDAADIENLPEMDNVPGLLAAQGIQGRNTTLRNVIVRIDSLKDVGNSIQNYRAALNIADNCKVENVYVIGSSYSNMSINVVEDAEAGTTEYVMTLSAPEGIEPGTYGSDDAIVADYVQMAIDMFKYMKNVDVTGQTLKIKFVAEKATKHFATEDEFQAYITDPENENIRKTFTRNRIWKLDGEGKLAWSIANTTVAVAGTKGYTMAAKPVADSSANPFSWFDFAGYNPSVTLAGAQAE